MFSKEEREILNQGHKRIAGIDEAGRGPLAGPVVSAIVVLEKNADYSRFFPYGLRDSKSLSSLQREKIFQEIKNSNLDWRTSIVSPQVIDKINIWQATLLSWQRSLDKLDFHPDFLFIDGKFSLPSIKISQKAIVKGDTKIAVLALASIIAKVTRDRLMLRLDQKYPLYGFALHKGYGTKKHLENLERYGPCAIHRKSFQPISNNLSFEKSQ